MRELAEVRWSGIIIRVVGKKEINVASKESADKKVTDDRISDENKLEDEMTEGKSPDEVAAIYREGDNYYCAECHSELPVHQTCPQCHLEVDWDRITSEIRH